MGHHCVFCANIHLQCVCDNSPCHCNSGLLRTTQCWCLVQQTNKQTNKQTNTIIKTKPFLFLHGQTVKQRSAFYMFLVVSPRRLCVNFFSPKCVKIPAMSNCGMLLGRLHNWGVGRDADLGLLLQWHCGQGGLTIPRQLPNPTFCIFLQIKMVSVFGLRIEELYHFPAPY